MSKIFYDHLINFSKIEKLIQTSAGSGEEKEELWKVVDEIVHHQVMGCILDNLDKRNHTEFIDKFQRAPFDDQLITYLEEKSGNKISEKIKITVQKIETEIIKDLKK